MVAGFQGSPSNAPLVVFPCPCGSFPQWATGYCLSGRVTPEARDEAPAVLSLVFLTQVHRAVILWGHQAAHEASFQSQHSPTRPVSGQHWQQVPSSNRASGWLQPSRAGSRPTPGSHSGHLPHRNSESTLAVVSVTTLVWKAATDNR